MAALSMSDVADAISIAGPLADLATCSTKSFIDVFAAGVFRAALPPPGLPRPADGSCVAP